MKYVRISELAKYGQAGIAGLALAMRELAIAESLRMIHGPERGVERYKELGGAVRFDEEGEPMVPIREA